MTGKIVQIRCGMMLRRRAAVSHIRLQAPHCDRGTEGLQVRLEHEHVYQKTKENKISVDDVILAIMV